MTFAQQVDVDELAQAQQFIADAPPLDGVQQIRVQLGEDSSGDAAMWLIFKLEENFIADRAWIRRFNEYAAVIQTRILHSGFGRFPYTRLEPSV